VLLSSKKVVLRKPLVALVTLVTLFEMYIPLKVITLEEPPVYAYMKDEFAPQTRFVVYPYSVAHEAFYWLPKHQQLLANIRGYHKFQFNTEKFTEALVKDGGIGLLVERDVDLLLVHKDLSADKMNLFSESPLLLLEDEVGEYAVFKVLMKGSDKI